MRILVVFYFLSAALAAPARAQVKADLGVSASAGIGASGAAVAVPLSAAVLAPPLVTSNLAPLSAPSPVLSAVPAALAAPAALAPAEAAVQRTPGGAAEGARVNANSDADWNAGAALFDNYLGEADPSAAALPDAPSGGAAPLSAWSARAARSPGAAAYARAVKAASSAGWIGQGAPVLDAAETFLSAQGVKYERGKIASADGASEGLRIAPERGRSPLNDLAYDAHRQLGADVAYIPERTRDATAAFNGRQRLLMVANFDRPDFFMGAIHEARHAWYSALLRRGDIRLFHLQAVARPGRSIAPNAEVYARYMSLEELSNFPKTLKHMITEQGKLDGDAAQYLADRTTVRARQFIDILRSAASIAAQIEWVDAHAGLKPRRMTPAEVEARDLEPAEGIDYFALELSNQTLYIPVLRRETRRFGVKVVRGSQDEARAALRLRAKLLRELVDASAPSAGAYLEAARAGDWAAAGTAADRLIADVRAAESAWPAEAH